MKTPITALAMVLAAAGMPVAAQDAEDASPSEAFEEAFEEIAEGDAAEPGVRDETLGEWRLYDGPTVAGDRRVFMHKDLGPERYVEFDMTEGGGATLAMVDPDCGFTSNFSVEELGEDRAAGLAEKLAGLLEENSCDAAPAMGAEELAEPLALLEAWVAERPFPAAGYWKGETRVLTLGEGEGRGVGRYEGRVSIVYLEPDEDARGPAEVLVNIYDCDAFAGRTLPVASGDPAEAQDIARAVLEERAAACALDPGLAARLTEGLPEALARQAQYRSARAADDDYDETEDDLALDDDPEEPEGT